MGLGYFTIDEENRICALHGEVLKFARRDKPFVRWYGSGTLQENDLICFCGKTLCAEDLLRAFAQEPLAEPEEEMVLLATFGNKACFPFMKVITNQEGTLIDLVYSGKKVRVSRDSSQNRLKIEIDGQTVESKTGDGYKLVVQNHSGIRYFSPEGREESSLRDIIHGGRFPAYLGEKLPLAMEAFFDEATVAAILSVQRKDRPVFLNICERQTAVTMIDDRTLQENLRIFSIGDETDYLSMLKEYTTIYDQLYFGRKIKVSRDELDCEARLRGYGEEINRINGQLNKCCRKNVTIVLTGESGTGKTWLARQIHKNSRRADGPFITVNCAAIAYNLIESELFGYESGAFTGAHRGGKIGYFELARGGTLFLDEITELPLTLQGKLLEVLQEGTFYRVGGTEKISTDIRLIVATNRNLENLVRERKFREDLYYRINVFPIHLPPLRERVDDLYSIIEDTLPTICERLEIEPMMLSQAAIEKMSAYSWPGNIRELENILEKAAVLADENLIRAEDIVLNKPIAEMQNGHTLKEKTEAYEKETIQAAYEKFAGDRKKIAAYLGLSKTNLFDKIRKYRIGEDE